MLEAEQLRVLLQAEQSFAGSSHDVAYALFNSLPLLVQWGKIDLVCLVAAMPGRHSGDQVHIVKKTAAPLCLFYGGTLPCARGRSALCTGWAFVEDDGGHSANL